MEHLQNAMKEGEFARFVNDAIATINYKKEYEKISPALTGQIK